MGCSDQQESTLAGGGTPLLQLLGYRAKTLLRRGVGAERDPLDGVSLLRFPASELDVFRSRLSSLWMDDHVSLGLQLLISVGLPFNRNAASCPQQQPATDPPEAAGAGTSGHENRSSLPIGRRTWNPPHRGRYRDSSGFTARRDNPWPEKPLYFHPDRHFRQGSRSKHHG